MKLSNSALLSRVLLKLIILSIVIIIFKYVGDRSCIILFNPDSIIKTEDRSSENEKHEQLLIANYLKIKLIQNKYSRMSDLDFSDLGDTKLLREKKMIGWVQIPGVVVNYPIMYSKTNEYYLKHSSEGKSSPAGAIFMDASSDGFWNQINLIHGHNMMSGAMFGELYKYKNKEWAKKHKYIYVTEDDGLIYKFNVFSVFNVNGNTEEIKVSCASNKEYRRYYRQLAERSLYQLDTPSEDAQIIILNTCSYSYNGEHLIICAYTED